MRIAIQRNDGIKFNRDGIVSSTDFSNENIQDDIAEVLWLTDPCRKLTDAKTTYQLLWLLKRDVIEHRRMRALEEKYFCIHI